MNRIPCHAVFAIDADPFGYMEPEDAERSRAARLAARIGPYVNSEARKRREQQPEHPCYAPQGEHKL